MKFVFESPDNLILEESGYEVFSWTNRNEILNKWFDGSLEKERYDHLKNFMINAKDIIFSNFNISSDWKVKIAKWLVNWGYDKKLAPPYKKSLYALLKELSKEDYYHARLYLKTIFTDDSFNTVIGKDREDEAKSYFFEKSDAKFSKLEATENEKQHILKNSAEWFLRRYDLETAWKLFTASKKLTIQQKNVKPRKLHKIGDWQKNHAVLIVGLAILSALIAVWLSVLIREASCLMTILMVFILSFIIGLSIYIIGRRESWLAKLILPRMLGAIIIGYVPTIFTEEMWIFAYRIYHSGWLLIPIVFLALIASFVYLVIEIDKTQISKRNSLLRASIVLVIGLIEALVIGLVLCYFTSISFSPENFETLVRDGININPIVDIFMGKIYPHVLIIFVPLAMFIGIFVQIIWEDKPISEPL